MHNIKKIISLFPCVLSIAASAKTIYSGEFDYRKFEPSSMYFSGFTSSEISKLCEIGEHAGTMDISECAHRNYERANRNLEKKLKALRSEIVENDKSLKADGEPLALPYFVKSQEIWAQYRESGCYYETYMLGEASMRYITFWDCMTRITKSRLDELTRSGADD
ncbi:lysozyme inhibitor LprI family protein [Paraburkholderia gardini]|uniref:lysozyme inhibitor LprI family protein n=1 Tax=Paraburkholderia gardini TaxID=2823469 RepID=UPI001D202957|nr:lysozyme inhibitor LprI family protein [Paraburkholderia gardini]CAG4913181.1 hypothetical protein R69919_04068 [Paraburkholderia gardini]